MRPSVCALLRSARQPKPLAPQRTISTRPTILASTLYSPTPTSLAAYLESYPPPSNHLTIYTVCTTLPDLPGLLPSLQAIPDSIGSFSHPPPSFSNSGLQPGRLGSAYISIAHLPSLGGKIWRSDLTGRRAVEVGRWHRPHKEGTGSEDRKGAALGELGAARGDLGADGGGWEGAWEAERELSRIEELEGVDAQTILLLTDASPRPTLRALDQMFPHSIKSGLITAPTPFLTGRPHTLLMNKEIYSGGSVGLALPYKLDIGLELNLEPMGESVIVEKSQGNMLLSFTTHANPTQVLITAIQKRGGQGLTKDEDFYLALLTPGGAIREAVKILSGDPSRGALSLEMEDSLSSGQAVQFMQSKKSQPAIPLSPASITFGALARSDIEEETITGEPRTEEGFVGLSEGGFVYSVEGRTAVGTSAGGFAQLSIGR